MISRNVMKKKYISPRIMVVEMESAAILATSSTDTDPKINVSEEWADEDGEVL